MRPTSQARGLEPRASEPSPFRSRRVHLDFGVLAASARLPRGEHDHRLQRGWLVAHLVIGGRA